ncbi:MAG: hypothetical protein H7Y17_06950 [Chlorobia bacterium]|nr:hypothetical protein [Fimbriimonadaceae bacterium]
MNRIKTTMIVGSMAIAAIASAQGIKVTVNNDPVGFDGAQPMTIGNRVFVPLRGVFEQMGAYVDWDAQTQMVTANRQQTKVQLKIGDSSAWVDGRTMMMDAPARLIQGRTMVPLRFLSESLGASVEWIAPTRTVEIMTSAVITNERNIPPINRTELLIEDGTVIPVILDKELSSMDSNAGDKFTATVRSSGSDYAGLPAGTKIQGVVVSAKPKEGRNPGMLELDFRRAVLPDGRSMAIDGSLIGLDANSVERRENGTYVAKTSKKDDRIVYAGYGAGAGLLVGLLTKKPLEGAVLGGVLGYLFGEVQRNQERAADVTLKSGTEFGVRLDRDLAWRSSR